MFRAQLLSLRPFFPNDSRHNLNAMAARRPLTGYRRRDVPTAGTGLDDERDNRSAASPPWQVAVNVRVWPMTNPGRSGCVVATVTA